MRRQLAVLVPSGYLLARQFIHHLGDGLFGFGFRCASWHGSYSIRTIDSVLADNFPMAAVFWANAPDRITFLKFLEMPLDSV